MSKYEQYVTKYARDYCNGDTELAKQHAIVKEVKKQYDEEEQQNSKVFEKVL